MTLASVTAGKPSERAQRSSEVEARCQTPISTWADDEHPDAACSLSGFMPVELD